MRRRQSGRSFAGFFLRLFCRKLLVIRGVLNGLTHDTSPAKTPLGSDPGILPVPPALEVTPRPPARGFRRGSCEAILGHRAEKRFDMCKEKKHVARHREGREARGMNCCTVII